MSDIRDIIEENTDAGAMAEEREKNKPITLIAKELEKDLMFVINNCRVPPFIIVMILKLVLNQVENIANAQYARDKQQYDNYLNEQ